MTTPRQPADQHRWSLDELFSALERTATVDHLKRSTKQRVLSRARQSRHQSSKLATALVFVSATAAAAGVTQAVSTEIERRAFTEPPPSVVHGTPTSASRSLRNGSAEFERSEAGEPGASHTAGAPSYKPSAGDNRLDAPLADARAAAAQRRQAPATTQRATPRHHKPQGANDDDPTQVAQALQALRKQNNPKQARTLLHGYLHKHPDGTLSEEALALSIEAWLNDNPQRAASYARRYLVKFPAGRYRKVAERALSLVAK